MKGPGRPEVIFPLSRSVHPCRLAAVALAICPAASFANGYWLWGAADNVRLPVLNAVLIAEKLLAS